MIDGHHTGRNGRLAEGIDGVGGSVERVLDSRPLARHPDGRPLSVVPVPGLGLEAEDTNAVVVGSQGREQQLGGPEEAATPYMAGPPSLFGSIPQERMPR